MRGLVRLVYQGRGTAIWVLVTLRNKRWATRISPPPRSLIAARTLLKEAGSPGPLGPWRSTLQEFQRQAVEFSFLTSPPTADRAKMAALLQDDLKQLGMRVQVVRWNFGPSSIASLRPRSTMPV